MRRQALDDGRWFDMDKARCFEETVYWNGNNNISSATHSQWDHEALYHTASGLWILNHWSQWQGSRESWVEITDREAAKWLVLNDHDPDDACAEEYASLEV